MGAVKSAPWCPLSVSMLWALLLAVATGTAFAQETTAQQGSGPLPVPGQDGGSPPAYAPPPYGGGYYTAPPPSYGPYPGTTPPPPYGAYPPGPPPIWSDLFYTWTFSTRPQEIWITCNQVVAIVWPAFNTFPGYGYPMHDLEQISAPDCSLEGEDLAAASDSGIVELVFDTPGPRYFKSGVGQHCSMGNMLLTVHVEDRDGSCTAGVEPPSPSAPLPEPAPKEISIPWGFFSAPQQLDVDCGTTVNLWWNTESNIPHDVVAIPTANCNLDGSHYSEPSNQGNVTLKFEQPGTRYFKCSVGEHCARGNMLLRVNVGGPGCPAQGPPPPVPAPSAAPPVALVLWTFFNASQEVAMDCDTTLVVSWGSETATIPHDVESIPSADCSLNGTVVGTYGTMGRYEVKYDKAGTYYYKCGVGQHCSAGNMLLAVNVQGKGCSSPDPAPPPPAASVPSPAVPEESEFIYQWAFANATQRLTVNCQTTLVLQWGNSNSTTRHNVEQINAADCSLTGTQVGALATMGSYAVKYDQPGTYYYKCGVGVHCSFGKMLLTVTVAGTGCGGGGATPRGHRRMLLD